MSKWFMDNGVLSEEGWRLLIDFKYGLQNLMESDATYDMSDEELRALGCHLAKMVGDAITNKLQHRLQQSSRFDAMSDKEFEQYLAGKYGPSWAFMTLTSEEMARVPILTEEKILQSLKEGAKHVTNFPKPGVILPSRRGSARFRKPGPRFK